MIKKQGKPISGGAGQFRPTPNVLSDAAATSRDGQKLAKQPPAPFQNRQGAAQIPAPTQSYNRASSDFAKDGMRFGGRGKSVSIHGKPTVDLSAVGEPRYPKGYNPIISGFPLSSPRTAGQISTNRGPQANAKEMKRIRSQYPGILGRGR
jgi:hypothetical protein